MDHSALSERYRGCLLGLACGDAVGTTAEFAARGSFAPITDMVGGGPFGLPPGKWTDDTSMALCLAESLLAKKGFDPRDQMARYVNWWQWGYNSSTGECFDIGLTVRSALMAYMKTGEPFAGSTDPKTAGNGSLSLWCFAQTESFEAAVLEAANPGRRCGYHRSDRRPTGRCTLRHNGHSCALAGSSAPAGRDRYDSPSPASSLRELYDIFSALAVVSKRF